MIEVEAAQEILVRLAVAAVLGDDDAGDELKQVAGPSVGRPSISFDVTVPALAASALPTELR